MCFVLAVIACQSSGADTWREGRDPAPAGSTKGDAVLAQFGDRTLTVRDFEARLASLPPQVRAQYARPEARERLLQDMVRLELLFDEARRRGFDQSPPVKVRVAEIVVEEMMSGLFGSESAQVASITQEEMRAYYDAHAAEFRSPEERRATELVFPSRDAAEAARRRIPGRGAVPATVEKVAREAGVTVTDLGFFSVGSTDRPPDAVRDAVFGIEDDASAAVVENAGKFHVLTLTGVRPAIVRELRDVETLVRARIAQEKRRAAVARFVDEVSAGAKPRVYRERLPQARAAPSAGVTEP